MDRKEAGRENLKPSTVKKNQVEEVMKKDSSTEALVKAIKTLLNKDSK